MIKLEHIVLPSPDQMKFIIEGMRNPMNSWDIGDSDICDDCCSDCGAEYRECECYPNFIEDFRVGEKDYDLMSRLAKAGKDHRKYMRMMSVYVRITAPLYWWKEADTYKIGTAANSCSTMHKIHEKEFTFDDFSHEHIVCLTTLDYIIQELNCWRSRYIQYDEDETVGINLGMSKKDIWWQMIQLLPSSYNQTRNVMLNYEVLANMYHSRKNHKLDEWREFCKWIESLPLSYLITHREDNADESNNRKEDNK